MRKLLASTALVALISVPAIGYAQDNDAENLVGAGGGAAAGAVAGAAIGGPIGAVIGGFAGATLGSAAVPDEVVQYTVANPVEPVVVDTQLQVGTVVGEGVTLAPVPDNDQYGYIYANGRAYIVDLNSREIVTSPGYVVNQPVVDYVQANPVEPVTLEGELAAGYEINGDIEVYEVPDAPGYSYIYVDGRPVVLDSTSRVIVWAPAP